MESVEIIKENKEGDLLVLDIITIEVGDESEGAHHHTTHPHVVHVYSEVDERDHTFRVHDKTLVSHVIKEFYRSTDTKSSEFDLFKVQSNGEDVGKHPSRTIGEFLREKECNPLVWIFTNHVHVEVEINNVKVVFHTTEAKGLFIKETAIAQGVLIKPDFCLFLVKNGRQDPIADDQAVHLHRGEVFDAVDPDHCS